MQETSTTEFRVLSISELCRSPEGTDNMRYLAMIFAKESDDRQTEAECRQHFEQFARFNKDAREAGVFLGGEALKPGETATVVRMMENGASVTDGPFTESKEAVAGFYMLNCENLDQAIEWAARIPAARYGAIEVRPILELDI